MNALVAISFCWSPKTDVFICRNSLEKSHITSSLHTQQCLACFVCLTWFVWWELSGHRAIVVLGAASRIFFKTACSILESFSSSVLFSNISWCNHTDVLSWQWLGWFPVLYYQQDQISLWSITCQLQTLPMRILTSISVNEQRNYIRHNSYVRFDMIRGIGSCFYLLHNSGRYKETLSPCFIYSMSHLFLSSRLFPFLSFRNWDKLYWTKK